ncbi:MAG: ribose 5-phosphate isomerase A [Candidatus Hodarchaeales archaeon]|jgi:ribose 5-phosphate isomerase A
MNNSEELKQRVSQYALKYILDENLPNSQDSRNDKDEITITSGNSKILWLGIGSGSTIRFFIDELGKIIQSSSFNIIIKVVSSSIDTSIQCRKWDIPVFSLEDLQDRQFLDIYIDGADEVNHKNESLKGRGGAHTREKLIQLAAHKFYLIIDETKAVNNLGELGTPIVCEILSFGYGQTINRLKKIIPKPEKVSIRYGKGKMGPIITDNGNFIADIHFKQDIPIQNVNKLEIDLKTIPGVIETGIFSQPADTVFIGTKEKIIIRNK